MKIVNLSKQVNYVEAFFQLNTYYYYEYTETSDYFYRNLIFMYMLKFEIEKIEINDSI